MRNLRRIFRRASLLSSAKRRRESARGSRNDSTLRRLSSEALEKRELLAGDLGTAANHNYWNAYDVNDDHQICRFRCARCNQLSWDRWRR